MNLSSAELQTSRTVTEADQRNGRLITLLLCNAQFLLGIQQCAMSGLDPSSNMNVLLQGLLGICESDGARLESDAIALARELGINVIQHRVHKGSGVPQ